MLLTCLHWMHKQEAACILFLHDIEAGSCWSISFTWQPMWQTQSIHCWLFAAGSSMNELHCTLAVLVHTCGHIGPWLLGIWAHPVPSLSAMDLQTFETWLSAGGTTFQVASAPGATIWPFAFGSGIGLGIWLLLFVGHPWPW